MDSWAADWSPVDLLPGLWLGVLALLLHRALRRWYDAVPGPVFAAFCLALLVLFGPVLFGGRLLLPLDTLRGQAPFRSLAPTQPHGNDLQGDLIELVGPSIAEARTLWSAGRWPLWNARVGAGMPLLGDPQAQVLQPLVLLGWPLPWERAAAITAALRVLFALIFTFLWIRSQGPALGPALAGAFAFGLGGFVLLWLGWPIANAAALLPAVLYALGRCRSGGRRDFLLLALTAWALFLGGHPETVAYAVAFALAVLAAQTLDRSDGAPLTLPLRSLRRALFALLLAGLAAAPALLPAMLYLPQSLRASRVREGILAPPASAASVGEDFARRLLPIAAPNAYGNSRFVDYWGLSNTNEDASGFVGTAALLAVLLALRVRRRFPLERLALGVVLLCLLVLAHPPGLDRLPPAAIGESRRLLLPLSLALSYLAACTLERFRRGEADRRTILPAAAVLAVVIAWGIAAHPDPADPARLAILRFGWLRWQMRFLGLAALLLAAGWKRSWMPPLVAGLIAAELLLLHLPANPPMPKRLTFPVNGPLRFLQDNAKRTRIAALGRALPPNLSTVYGLSDARVYNPMASRAYLDWLAPIRTGWWGEIPELGAPGHPLYQRMGVRYLLTEPAASLPIPLRRVFSDANAAIWEIPGPLQRLTVLGGQGRVRFDTMSADQVQVRVDLPREALLASSIYQDGAWRVLRNREPWPATPADGPFVAARLPSGASRIDLLYRPAGFVVGCLLAALALAAGAAAWMPRPTDLLSTDLSPASTDPAPPPPPGAP